jgi:hypothetical protein
MNFEKLTSKETAAKDITPEFLNQNESFSFSSFLRTMKEEPLLEIRADLTKITDQQEFISMARKAKAFLEAAKPEGQERKASIRCSKPQMTWEKNVFSSGVQWEEAE